MHICLQSEPACSRSGESTTFALQTHGFLVHFTQTGQFHNIGSLKACITSNPGDGSTDMYSGLRRNNKYVQTNRSD